MPNPVKTAEMNDDQVIGPHELADLLNTTVSQIYKLTSSEPDRLPPRLVVFGRKLAWRVGSCKEWLRTQQVAHVTARNLQASAKRIGRPRVE